MTDDMTLTPALLKALRVLDVGEARYSNTTSAPDAEKRTVYHQAADMLARRGLANVYPDQRVAVTIAGRINLERAGARREGPAGPSAEKGSRGRVRARREGAGARAAPAGPLPA